MTSRKLSTLLIAVIAIILAPAAIAETPQATDLTQTFLDAGAAGDRLAVYEIAGIVLIRGQVASAAAGEKLGSIAQELGYARVANLVKVVEHNDEAIERAAEMELTMHRSLDGCEFRIDSEGGVVRLAGRVRHELQKDVALQVLRTIDGVRSVEATFERF